MLPFPGGIEDPSNGSVIFSVAAAALYFILIETRVSLLRSTVKTLAIALLAVLAILQQQPLLLIAALALSSLGDWFLSRDGDKAFLLGLGSFLAAHIAYIALFWTVGGGLQLLQAEPWRLVLAGAMVIVALVMLVLLMRQVGPELRFPVTIYIFAILGMGLAALTMNSTWIIAGALAFMASDATLAAERFLVAAIAPGRLTMRIAVWLLYYAAQALIVIGFLVG
ncbi:MAG: lysoplasmalogenase family protein [Rhizobiaceae bacterium]